VLIFREGESLAEQFERNYHAIWILSLIMLFILLISHFFPNKDANRRDEFERLSVVSVGFIIFALLITSLLRVLI